MKTRRIVLAAGATLLLALVVIGFLPRPVAVDVAEVGRGPLTVTVEEEGRTRVRDRYVVSAPVAGYARRIELEVGDSVDRGQTLAGIEPVRPVVLDARNRAEARARVSASRAALAAAEQEAAAAEADADLAERELERRRELRAVQYVSEDQMDQAESRARAAAAALRSAQFAVDVARHELEAASTALEYTAADANGALELVEVSAPVDGRVLTRYRESEGVVAAGEPLLELGDPRALEVEIDVLSSDAVRISPGTAVRYLRWGGEAPLEGVVRIVEPTGFTKISALGVEEQRVLVIADITSSPEEWTRLGDGYRVEASFVLWQGDDVVKTPASAVFRRGDGWALYRIEGGRALLTPVSLGRRTGLEAQVLGGVDPGTAVIVHPGDDVGDGARVRRR